MEKFLQSTYKSITGVYEVNSGTPGKNIAIFAINHGNEKVGLEVFSELIDIQKIEKSCISGKIFLICVNIKAYKKNVRFIDHNMNRISLEDYNDTSYEHQRLKELRTLFPEIDIAIDLHSVSQGDDAMGICDTQDYKEFQKHMNIEHILTEHLSERGALISEFVRAGKTGIGIECGNHTSHKALSRGIDNVLSLLQYFGSITTYISTGKKTIPCCYRFYEEIDPLSSHFCFTKKYAPFESLEKGETFATDGERIYKNTSDKDICIGLLGDSVQVGDGIGFLFERIIK